MVSCLDDALKPKLKLVGCTENCGGGPILLFCAKNSILLICTNEFRFSGTGVILRVLLSHILLNLVLFMILRELIKMYLIYQMGNNLKGLVFEDWSSLQFQSDGSVYLKVKDQEYTFDNLDDFLSHPVIQENDLGRTLNQFALNWARTVNEALIRGIKQ